MDRRAHAMILALQHKGSAAGLARKASRIIQSKLTNAWNGCDYCKIGPLVGTFSDMDGTYITNFICVGCSSKFHSECVERDRMCLNHKNAICEICAWSTPDVAREWHTCISCNGYLCGECKSPRCLACIDKTCTVCDGSTRGIVFTHKSVKICAYCYHQNDMRMCSFCQVIFKGHSGRCPKMRADSPCGNYNCSACIEKSIYCLTHMREFVNSLNQTS
jgi:hypothetical protein